jgi:membrane protease YdiL (CAAX protease family)
MDRNDKQNGALHGAVFLAALLVVRVGLPPQPWPWYLLLPLFAYALAVIAWPRLRRSAPRLAVGRMTGWPLVAAVGLAIATSAALLIFDRFAHPDVAHLRAKLPLSENLLIGAVCFSLVNATLEELIFHRLLWEFIAAEWNSCVALIGTTVVFGLGHISGYPPGPLGAVLAGAFGLALGLLRWWTGGLGLAIVVHICADATVFALIASSANSGP